MGVFDKIHNPFKSENEVEGIDSSQSIHEEQFREAVKKWRLGGRVGPPPANMSVNPEFFSKEDFTEINRRTKVTDTILKARDRGIVGSGRNVTGARDSIVGGGAGKQGAILSGGGSSGGGQGGQVETRGPGTSSTQVRGSSGSLQNGILGSKNRQKRILG